MLRYGGHDYALHSARIDSSYWRCPSYGRGCRVLVSSRYVDGYLIVNKTKDEIIHTNHDKPHKKRFKKI